MSCPCGSEAGTVCVETEAQAHACVCLWQAGINICRIQMSSNILTCMDGPWKQSTAILKRVLVPAHCVSGTYSGCSRNTEHIKLDVDLHSHAAFSSLMLGAGRSRVEVKVLADTDGVKLYCNHGNQHQAPLMALLQFSLLKSATTVPLPPHCLL